MYNSNIKKILREYELKRNTAISVAEQKKLAIYNANPKLQEIENNLSKLSISKAKSLLNSNSKNLLKTLNIQIKNLKKEKENILLQLGLSKEYFLPNFECSLCNDSGYITNNYETSMCSCLKQKLFDLEYNDLNVYNIKNQTFENFSSTIYSDKVDKAKYNSEISPRKNICLIKNICNQFILNFDNPQSNNLLFTGNSGLGKTFLSSCIANELLKKGKTVLYQTSPVMLDSIINYRLGKATSDINICNHLLSTDLLIIDDLGTETINSMKFTELFTILNSRLLLQKNKVTKTIISTNLDLKNLASLYGERVISRLVGHYDLCYFFGDDIRFQKRIH